MSGYSDSYSQQMIRSIDGGNTWNLIQVRPIISQGVGFVTSIVFDPTDPSRVYASCDDNIYISLNNGANWFPLGIPTTTGPQINKRIPSEMIVDPSNGHLWVAFDDKSIQHGGACLFEITVNSSYPFQSSVTDRTPSQIVGNYEQARVDYSIATSQNIYSAYYVGGGAGKVSIIHQKLNSTNSYFQKDWPITIDYFWDKFQFEVSSSNAQIMYLAGLDTWKSTDGFNTKVQKTYRNGSGLNVLHADVRAFEIIKAGTTSSNDDEVILIGHDGGISISYTGLETTSNQPATLELNGIGLNITEIWHAESVGNKGDYVIGCHDNGTLKYSLGNWNRTLGGDGGAITKSNQQVGRLFGNASGNVYISNDNGSNWPQSGPSLYGLGEESFIKSPKTVLPTQYIFYPSITLDNLMIYNLTTNSSSTIFTQAGHMRLWGDLVDFEIEGTNGYLAVSRADNALDSCAIVRLVHDLSDDYKVLSWTDITPGLIGERKAAITDIEIGRAHV